MGGVQIKNCTEMPLRIQLKQVGVLYHDWIAPGETFTRNTGAVHFTINARWAERDDTSVFWNGVAPVAAVVGKTMLAAATAGKSVAALSAFASIHMSSSAAAGLIALGMSKPSAIALVTASVAASMQMAGLLVKTIAQGANKDHIEINSMGWYFGGRNQLEIHGGIRLASMAESKEP